MNTPSSTPYGHEYFERLPEGPGWHRLAHNTCTLIDYSLLVLRPGETKSFATEGREFGLDLLRGDVTIATRSGEWQLGRRDSVFDDLPHGAYVGCGDHVHITAHTEAEVALGSAPSHTPIEAYPILPAEVPTGSWGDNETLRHFRYLINGDRPSERLWFAEVMVTNGRWATYPPHKHEDVPEDLFQEEMYVYRVDPPHGFGFCGQFEGLVGADYAFMIRNNTVHKMPHGYHTVTAAPGYRVWYLAIYAGRDKRHRPSPHPDHQNFAANVAAWKTP